MADYQDISIALAGVCQSARIVQEFAHNGWTDDDAFRQSLRSLLVTEPDDVLEVFGGELYYLELGLNISQQQLGGMRGPLNTEISRYWIGMLALAEKLQRNPQAKRELTLRLVQLARQVPLYEYDLLHEQIISNIAAIYSEVISPLGAKIHVVGMEEFLSRPEIQKRVRASLLAGVRAATLWQQVGGSRWQFLFARKRLLATTKALYSSL
ncbi:lysogenization protein HflD [Pasteurellaceae bacterium Macca]|nr:lysogenization protein HflD [Pasteurellaceae bacterium Macca]